MSDIFNEVFGTADTSKLTPIEIALGVDENGMTTATKLYDYLELNPTNYAKWFRKNFVENNFAEENKDYFPFVLRYESLTGNKERQDAKLTATLAKKLSMSQRNEKGNAAQEYFIGVENGAKKMVGNKTKQISLTEHPGEVANLIKVVTNRMDKQGSAPYKSAEVTQIICEQFGIQLPDDFVKVPDEVQIYDQMHMSSLLK